MIHYVGNLGAQHANLSSANYRTHCSQNQRTVEITP